MQINFHSPDALLTDELKEYFEEKLTKPIERFKMDPETVRFDVDAGLHHESVGLRIRLSVPGLTISVSSLHTDPFAALDVALDKLSRKLRDNEEKRRDLLRRRGVSPSAALANLAPEDDLFTEDEEEVLREMGALDAVLNF